MAVICLFKTQEKTFPFVPLSPLPSQKWEHYGKQSTISLLDFHGQCYYCVKLLLANWSQSPVFPNFIMLTHTVIRNNRLNYSRMSLGHLTSVKETIFFDNNILGEINIRNQGRNFSGSTYKKIFSSYSGLYTNRASFLQGFFLFNGFSSRRTSQIVSGRKNKGTATIESDEEFSVKWVEDIQLF